MTDAERLRKAINTMLADPSAAYAVAAAIVEEFGPNQYGTQEEAAMALHQAVLDVAEGK